MAKFNHVLLVEDDPITVMVCDRVLRMSGFATNIVAKKNGQEGIDYIKELLANDGDLPNVIFLDINMPVMNGWDFLNDFSVLHENCKTLPKIYILSSTVNPEDKEKANTYSIVAGSISKPLTKEHLEKLI